MASPCLPPGFRLGSGRIVAADLPIANALERIPASHELPLRDQEVFERGMELQRFQLEAEERRSARKDRWWQVRASKDSIAAIVGGVLLIVLAIAVIAAMFTDTATTDVVQNSFLLILGYFFAATVSRPETGGGDHP